MASRTTSLQLLGLFLSCCIAVSEAASIFDIIDSSFTSLIYDQEEVVHTVTKNGQGYEERRYPSQRWVCKKHNGSLTAEAQRQAFLSLFDYLAGDNDQGLNMEMSVPASVMAPPKGVSNVFEACFYPGSKQQKHTPRPTSPELYIKTRPELKIFTREFGGYADTEEEWRTETDSLQKVLENAGESLQTDFYYWNAYDSPIKFWSRRNEVWIVKKETV